MSTPNNAATVKLNLVPGPLTDGTKAFPHPPPRLGRLGGLEYDNIVYSCEPGYRPLFLDLRIPRPATGPHPLIIWIHGGGWIYGSRRRLPPHLFDNAVHDHMLDAGYAVAAVDYRLAREAGFPGMLLDVKAAVRWLRGHADEFALDPQRVVLWGESAGGHLALMAAMCTALDGAERTGEHLEQSETPTAVVDWYGPTDLVTMSRLDLGRDSEEIGQTEERPEGVLQQHGTLDLRGALGHELRPARSSTDLRRTRNRRPDRPGRPQPRARHTPASGRRRGRVPRSAGRGPRVARRPIGHRHRRRVIGVRREDALSSHRRTVRPAARTTSTACAPP